MNHLAKSRIGRSLAVLLLLSLWLTALAFAQEWVQITNTPKAGGLGQAACGIVDQVLLIRGYSSGKCHLWQFDPDSTRISVLLEWDPPKSASFNPIPRPKSGTALAWDYGDFVYALFGGAGSDTDRTLFYRYGIQSGTWTQLKNTPHPQGAGDALVWCGYDNSVYALLGSDKRGSAIARYVPDDDDWQLLYE